MQVGRQKRLSTRVEEERDEISQACFSEWERDKDEKESKTSESKNPLESHHRCTSCYFKGQEEYMLPSSAFGVTSRSEFYSKYVAQGAWTRCLQCQKEAGCKFVCRQPPTSRLAQDDVCCQTPTSRLAQDNRLEAQVTTRLAHENGKEPLVCATCFAKELIV